MSENSGRANLKPFEAGRSGNPGGRPKTVLARAYREMLTRVDPEDPQGRTYAEVIADRIVRTAAHGKTGGWLLAAKEVGDRAEGKPAQSLTVDERPPATFVAREKLTPEAWSRRYAGAAPQDDEEGDDPEGDA